MTSNVSVKVCVCEYEMCVNANIKKCVHVRMWVAVCACTGVCVCTSAASYVVSLKDIAMK